MSVALDIGAHRLRSLRRTPTGLAARSVRAAYAVVPDEPSRREMLHRLGLPFAACEDDLVLMGDAAAEFARTLRIPTAELLPDGHVPHDDPPARQVLSALVEALLPEPSRTGGLCGLALPSGFGADDAETARDVEFLTRLVRLRGYEPHVIGSAMAVALATLVDCGLTGVAIDVGAAATELCVAHRGVEVVRCRLPRGGNWIDEEFARRRDATAWDGSGRRYLDVDRIRAEKEALADSVAEPTSPDATLLAELLADLTSQLLKEAARTLAAEPAVRRLPRPLTLVCSGGTTRSVGFATLFERIARRTPFPIELAGIRIATDVEYVVARGGLIAAELESRSRAA